MTEITINHKGDIIAPKTINIEGYHIVGKDDKIIFTLPSERSTEWYERTIDAIKGFSKEECKFLLLEGDFGITVLEKDG